MSGFVSKQFAATTPFSLSTDNSQNRFVTNFNSFDETTSYWLVVDGYAQCAVTSGTVKFDILFNKKVIVSRTFQTSSVLDTMALGMNWQVQCKDCVRTTDSDGNINYANEITLQFTWTPPTSLVNITTPSVQCLAVALLATA